MVGSRCGNMEQPVECRELLKLYIEPFLWGRACVLKIPGELRKILRKRKISVFEPYLLQVFERPDGSIEVIYHTVYKAPSRGKSKKEKIETVEKGEEEG